jgi:uncharacterized spore protein YtfJ
MSVSKHSVNKKYREDTMEHVIELMEEMVSTLSDTVRSEVVFGKTVDLGPAKIVPLSRISLGFGGGGGEGDQRFGHGHNRNKKDRSPAGKGTGSGGGGSAKVRPVGVIVFTEDGVTVEGIPDKMGLCDKIFDRIPDIIELAKKHKQ